jgi:hypothetical protein
VPEKSDNRFGDAVRCYQKDGNGYLTATVPGQNATVVFVQKPGQNVTPLRTDPGIATN